MNEPDVIVGIGDAAGDGVASAGNTLALSVARQGQAVYAYNSYQSVICGGHSWLRVRVSAKKPLTHGDQCWHPYRRPLHALQRLCGSCEADRRHVRQTVT
jgi:Pyruvate ferredoxin/flavodoxin oxidoreductase